MVKQNMRVFHGVQYIFKSINDIWEGNCVLGTDCKYYYKEYINQFHDQIHHRNIMINMSIIKPTMEIHDGYIFNFVTHDRNFCDIIKLFMEYYDHCLQHVLDKIIVIINSTFKPIIDTAFALSNS